jgi:hypothetical protein
VLPFPQSSVLQYSLNFNFDTDYRKLFATSGIYTLGARELWFTDSVDLSAFKRRGGKLMIYHGASIDCRGFPSSRSKISRIAPRSPPSAVAINLSASARSLAPSSDVAVTRVPPDCVMLSALAAARGLTPAQRG